jgi:putative hydrolase of the HAD superfamily
MTGEVKDATDRLWPMNDAEIKAVLFDLDDTLIDRAAAYDRFYRQLYDSSPDIHENASWDEARAFFWELSPNNATNPRTAILEIQRRWPGVEGDSESYYHAYLSGISGHVTPFPGAIEFVDDLNDTGLPWGIVTNGDHYQRRKVENAGLKERVAFVLASELFGVSKPAPGIYHEAYRLLGVPGLAYGDILFVGDNPYTDILGAHGVGMRTAWVRMGREYPDDAPTPDLIIENVDDLRPLLGI